ncbi:MAG: nucleotidyl transferase AbiEii/AbiGii toxin family protein [Patescibacteria group bacterium]
MLSLEQIAQQFPENLRNRDRRILTEYLQYKVLDKIFKCKHSNKLSFLGGTALRIVFGITRFSEDLDFDNFNLTEEEFGEIVNEVSTALTLEGYDIETRLVFKGAFRCYMKFNNVLSANGITTDKKEKLLIQIDAAPHNFAYKPELKLIGKLDILTEIFATPIDILFSQKILAAFGRKRAKGRDFYDLIYILGISKKVNYKYLQAKLEIKNWKELKSYVLKECDKLDFKDLARDVQPLLFNSEESKKVRLFRNYFAGLEL